MFLRLFLLFTVVPAIELYLLIKVGGIIGAERTIIIIILTGIIGAYLAKREGAKVWFDVQKKLASGQLPGQELVEALLLLITGALLVTPGFLTDIVGFAFLIPLVRKFVAAELKKRFAKNVFIPPEPFDDPFGPGQGPFQNQGPVGSDQSPPTVTHEIIEYKEISDPDNRSDDE